MKYVKYIGERSSWMTYGKSYEVIDESDRFYCIRDDEGDRSNRSKKSFESVNNNSTDSSTKKVYTKDDLFVGMRIKDSYTEPIVILNLTSSECSYQRNGDDGDDINETSINSIVMHLNESHTTVLNPKREESNSRSKSTQVPQDLTIKDEENPNRKQILLLL